MQDTNRAGFLIKLDYDWIHVDDVGSRDEGLFAIAGRTVQVCLCRVSVFPTSRGTAWRAGCFPHLEVPLGVPADAVLGFRAI